MSQKCVGKWLPGRPRKKWKYNFKLDVLEMASRWFVAMRILWKWLGSRNAAFGIICVATLRSAITIAVILTHILISQLDYVTACKNNLKLYNINFNYCPCVLDKLIYSIIALLVRPSWEATSSMEHEGSLLCWQEHSTYHDPVESSSYHPIQSL